LVTKKLGMTAVSVAVLAACAPPQQAMNSDPNAEAEIICTKHAQVDSHIKDETCVRVVKGGSDDFPAADDPFRKNPQASGRSARTGPGPSTHLPPSIEGSCGAATDD
jgi:hypothetical protein